jgi:hypothetical protein
MTAPDAAKEVRRTGVNFRDMSRLIVAAALVAWSRSADASPGDDWTPLDVSLFYPVCFFHGDEKTINGLSLNILHGWTPTVRGAEIGGLVNAEEHLFVGLQVAGLYNIVFGEGAGLQIGGLGSEVRGEFFGVQIGGIATSVGKGVSFQFGGFANNSVESASGLQIATLFHVNGTTFPILGMIAAKDGFVQAPAISSHSESIYSGAQISGLMNMGVAIRGTQIAGIATSFHWTESTRPVACRSPALSMAQVQLTARRWQVS